MIETCFGFSEFEEVCDEVEWSGSNHCMLRVQTDGETCNDYCESQGSTCVRAQDNTNGCIRAESHSEGCDVAWNDQICVCDSKWHVQI